MFDIALPEFSKIDIEPYAAKLDDLLQANLQQVKVLLTHKTPHTWDSLMQPLEDMDDAIERFWSPFAHLHAVVNSPCLLYTSPSPRD